MTVDGVSVQMSKIQGRGVFATRDFQAGERLLTIDDSCLVAAAHQPDEQEAVYCDYLSGGRVVVMQSPERYINHSCDPNSFVRSREDRREVIALRSIPATHEITYDYSINGFGDTIWTCCCGSARCRHSVHSDFFHLPMKLQAEYLPYLDAWFREEHEAQLRLLHEQLGTALA